MAKNYFLGTVLTLSLFLSASHVAAAEMYGVFMVTKGIVRIISPKAGTSDAKVGAKVFEGDSITTGADSRAKIVMSDRNVININPDSKIEISKYRNDGEGGNKNVELKLLQGKVRNNVEQTYDGDKSKFIIKTPTAVAGVRGTQFLAGFDPSTQMTSIVTFKGSVSLATVNPQGQVVGTPVVVKKGEMTTAAANKPPEPPKTLPKEEVKKLDMDTASASQGNKEVSKENRDSAADNKKESKENSGDSKKESSADNKKEQPKNSDPGSGKKDQASTTSNEKAPNNQTPAATGPTSDSGGNREPASTVGNSGVSSGSSNSSPPPAPPPPISDSAGAPTMIDKRDLDVGIAKDIGGSKGAPLPPPPPPILAPPAPSAGTTPMTDIIRDNMGKSKVIIQPR